MRLGQYPWPPQLIDGFDVIRSQGLPNAQQIRALRQQLQQERVVSWFTTPSDLEARVSAAVTMAGLTRQLDLQPAALAGGRADDSSAEEGIKQAILQAGARQRAPKIDLATTWWSTRLYLLAAIAERLTQVWRILIVDAAPPIAVAAADASTSTVATSTEERFVGQISTAAILSTIGPKVDQLGKFQDWLQKLPTVFNDLNTELQALLDRWREAFGNNPQHVKEKAAKVNRTPDLLRRWLGDAMLQQPVHIADLQPASVVDLLRPLDYPNDYAPVLTRRAGASESTMASEHVEVMDKSALNARLAQLPPGTHGPSPYRMSHRRLHLVRAN